MYGDIRIFTGTAHPALAESICHYLHIPLGKAEVFEFSNENIFVRLKESVRGQDVFVIQSFSSPVSKSILELLIILDTLKRASADRITAVIPYYAYARSDKKDQPRVPITARLLADLITTAGANRVLTMDLHARQVGGFFNIPVDELTALHLLARYFQDKKLQDVVIVAPDIGAAKRARDFALRLDAPFAIINKRRLNREGDVEALNIIGDVAGGCCILVDDEINTGGSVVAAARALMEAGALYVYVCCTHPVFSGAAMTALGAFPFPEIVVTDTIPVPAEKRLPNMTVLSIAPLLGSVIEYIHLGKSVAEIFGE